MQKGFSVHSNFLYKLFVIIDLNGLTFKIISDVVERHPIGALILETGMQNVYLFQVFKILNGQEFHDFFEICIGSFGR